MAGLRAHQRGVGLSGLLLILVLVAFAAVVLLRMAPAYVSFWTVRSAMNSVAESPEPIVGGKMGIMDLINRRLEINDVRGIDPKSFKIQKGGNGNYDVQLEYERREHLFANIDVGMTFDHHVEVKGQ
jgi:Domain of unknown function (DUF4845)